MRNIFSITFLVLALTVLFSGVTNAYTFSCDSGTSNSVAQVFNEIKTVDGSEVDKIFVTSTYADVNIYPSNTSEVEVYLYGKANSDKELHFDVDVIEQYRKLIVAVQSTGSYFNGNLKLNILIPQKMFESIYVFGPHANVNIDQNIIVNDLEVTTFSGNIKSYADANQTTFITDSGEVETIR